MQIEIVTNDAVSQIITPRLAYEACKEAFISVWKGSAARFPVFAGRGANAGSSLNIKFAYDTALDALGFKAGSYWPENESRGLPNHGATTMLFDPATGFPLALINARELNRWRTAGADAVAADVLARHDSSTLAVIGAGRQAEFEVRALLEVRALQHIRVASRTPERSQRLAQSLADTGVDIEVSSVREAVEGADIIVTVTNARSPLIELEWVKPGTHISAMGADAIGKQELDPRLLRACSLFADDPAQARLIGECQHLGEQVSAAAIQPIGAVLAGAAVGRRDSKEVTVFDSSGLAAQDLAAAMRVLAAARTRGLCTTIKL